MKKLFFVVAGFALLVAAAFAQAQVLGTAAQSVYLERGSSYALGIDLNNPSQNERIDIRLYATTSSSDITAEFLNWNDSIRNISLGAGETTKVGVLIAAEPTAPNGTYTLSLRADYNGISETQNVSVQVNQTPQVQLSQLSSGACADYGIAAIKVAVANNTPSSMNVYLVPESEAFLPRAKPSYIEMLPNTEKRVGIELSVPGNAVIGQSAQFSLMAKASAPSGTAGTITKKRILFSWVSCVPKQSEFTFNVAQPTLPSGGCLQIEKNTAKSFTVRAYNLLNQTLGLQVQASAGIDFNLSESALEIPANSYRESVLTAMPKSWNPSGKYYFDVTGTSVGQSEKARFCFEVMPEHGMALKALDSNREIAVGKMAVFGFEVENFGDYNETIALGALAHNDIDASLSDSTLAMAPHSKKTVFMSISPKPNAAIGERSVAFRAVLASTGLALQRSAQFSVIEKPKAKAEGGIEISSYPQTVNLAQGEEKRLVVTLTNPTAGAMRNVSVSFEGLPANIYFPSIDLRELGAGQSQQLVGTIKAAENAEARNFQAVLRADSDNYFEEAQVQFNLEEARPKAKEAPAGILTGLFALSGKGSGAFLVAIALAIILFFYGLHVAWHRRKSGLPIGRRAARRR